MSASCTPRSDIRQALARAAGEFRSSSAATPCTSRPGSWRLPGAPAERTKRTCSAGGGADSLSAMYAAKVCVGPDLFIPRQIGDADGSP